MDIRSIDTGAGIEDLIITAHLSTLGADAGSIEVLKTLPYPIQITEIRVVLTGKLVTASSTHLIKITDGTNDVCANLTLALADTIGTEYVGTINATYAKLQGAKKLVLVGTAGGTASTGGHALVIIKAKKIGEAS